MWKICIGSWYLLSKPTTDILVYSTLSDIQYLGLLVTADLFTNS